jgi:hypothetical protein
MKRGLLLMLAVAVVLATAASTASASPSAKYPKFFPFQSPSGNIGCYIYKKGVRCDIREHTWPTPPKPANCDVDYGQGVGLGEHGRADYVCAGDTALDPSSPVLGYGDRISKGNIRCASKTKGMRCVNLDTDNGFFLSRDVVRLF